MAILGDGVSILGVVLDKPRGKGGVEDGLAGARANGPNAAGPVEQIGRGNTFKSARCAQGDGGEERGAGNADFGVGGKDGALGGGDVGSAFEKLGGNGHRNGRRRGVHRHRRKGKGGRRLADEHGDGVLELSAQDAEVGVLGFGGFELHFGLGDVLVGVNAGFVEDLGELKGVAEALTVSS